MQRGAEVHLVPWDQDLLSLDYDGLFISNGPGDPSLAKTLINNVHKVGCFTNVYVNWETWVLIRRFNKELKLLQSSIYIIFNIFVSTISFHNCVYSSTIVSVIIFILWRCWRAIVPSQYLGSVWAIRSLPWLQEPSHTNYLWATGDQFNSQS